MKGFVSLFAENSVFSKTAKVPHASSSICAVCSNTFIKRLSENSDFRRESINDKALKPT